ncbi:MAG TPA: amino acid adenylation domain-containing protein [Steroidobacteraceae bacterium]|nr:amino acid adenylation domain-containing protein [Steroidobacteraceae bacterium]
MASAVTELDDLLLKSAAPIDLGAAVGLPLMRSRSRAYSSKRAELAITTDSRYRTTNRPAAKLLAATAYILHRYSGEPRISIGTAPAIGAPTNALAISVALDGDAHPARLVDCVAAAIGEANTAAVVPYSELIERLGLADVANQNPLFGVAVCDVEDQGQIADTRCDLVLTWNRSIGELRANFSARLLDSKVVRRFCRHVLNALAMIEEAKISLRDFDYLDANERGDLLEMGKGPAGAICPHASVVELFVEQVAKTPDSIALQDCGPEKLRWTYRELYDVSQRFAAQLQHVHSVRRGDRVGLCLPIGANQLAWMLAILRCGAVVVPIDVTFPPYRIANIVRSAALKHVIAERGFLHLLPENTPTLMVDELSTKVPAERFEPPVIEEDDPVYLLFTSGSTGVPKGVLMPHRSLTNLVRWQIVETRTHGEATFHRTSLTFDVSFQEIFSTLCDGGMLVIADEALRGDISRWPETFRAMNIARVFLPVIALQQLAEVVSEPIPSLKFLIVAGESLRITPSVMRLFRVLDSRLINHYGPTETHVATSYILPIESASWTDLPPIGRPLHNMRVLILDKFGHPAPVGIQGEICIAGPQLAIGYHGQEALTAERFTQVSAQDLDPVRVYRTGDFGKFNADGIIDFCGRRDDQVKLRGYRIELGEIETTLNSIEGVRQGAAALWVDVRGESRLAAYVVCDSDSPSNASIREVLKARLPDYMVPPVANIMRLTSLPLTQTGKLDRRALPRPAMIQDDHVSTTDARRDLASVPELVRSIWARHLRTKVLDEATGFLDLGGHSLLAIQLVSEINERLEIAVPLPELLRGPSLGKFTAVVERLVAAKAGLEHRAPAVSDADSAPAVRLPNGLTIFAPYPAEAEYLYQDIYQYRTYEQCGIDFAPCKTIVDVGANVGLFTLYALERAPGAKVLSIEPAPQLWTQLRRNVAAYGDRVISVNLAVGNSDYTGQFTYYPAAPAMSSLYPNHGHDRDLLAAILRNLTITSRPDMVDFVKCERGLLDDRLENPEAFPCRVRRLSRVCAELDFQEIDLLKIDVQRAELQVLEGIGEADWNHIHQVVVEVHDIAGELERCIEYLERRGYSVKIGAQAPIHRESVIHFVYAIRSSGR